MHLCMCMCICNVSAGVCTFVCIKKEIRQKKKKPFHPFQVEFSVENLAYYLVTGTQTSVHSIMEQEHLTTKPSFKTLINNVLIHRNKIC